MKVTGGSDSHIDWYFYIHLKTRLRKLLEKINRIIKLVILCITWVRVYKDLDIITTNKTFS